MENIRPGQVVISKAGRDKKRRFIVKSIIDENHVYISDGDLRKIEKPKKKKLKHIKVTNIIADTIGKKLSENGNVEDFEIRDFLSSLKIENKQEV